MNIGRWLYSALDESSDSFFSSFENPWHMALSLINAVVVSAVNAGVVPCGNQQPVQIGQNPPPVSSTPVYAVVSPSGVGFSG